MRAWRTSCALLLFGLLACSGCAAPSRSADQSSTDVSRQVVSSDVASALEAGVDGDRDPALHLLSARERAELRAIYEPGGFVPLWVDARGRPSRDAREALAVLDGAAREGLDPGDFDVSVFGRLTASLDGAPTPSIPDIAAFDAALSSATLRYFRQVHIGRVDPLAIGFRMTAPADEHDFAAMLRSAIADHRVAETAAGLTPQLALYRELRSRLDHYRSLAADTTLVEPLPVRTTTVRPGEMDEGTPALQRRLVTLGDLAADAPIPSKSVYAGALVEGVKHFQLRHGLEADGVLGKSTRAALRVPLAWRVRQIELALERLRWLPHLGQERLLAVNIPMFHLWVWDVMPPDGTPSFGMGAIVGRALNRQTPVFVDEMRYVIFRPYWNIPLSILRSEILPELTRDPDYLEREDMEIVSGPGDDARPVPLSSQSLLQLQQGRLRVRQRPGPRNALGLVKFVFPNDENVYMHGTPAAQLFSRPRRDFSHGCVRVEDPIALAEWALEGQDAWNRDAIVAAMNGTESRRVDLVRPIRVILFYITAVVMPDDGTIHFSEDIYGHDRRLDQALSRFHSVR